MFKKNHWSGDSFPLRQSPFGVDILFVRISRFLELKIRRKYFFIKNDIHCSGLHIDHYCLARFNAELSFKFIQLG